MEQTAPEQMKETTKQREKGSITYSFATPHDPKEDILYVNVIPEYNCVNACRFCSRDDAIDGKPNIYEQKAGTVLYLPTFPSVEEIVNEIDSTRKRGLFRKTREVAFVGLGEPLLGLELVKDSIIGIKERGYRGKTRVDTNGLVKCWYGDIPFGCFERFERNPAKELRRAGLDEIRISVNATSEEEYQLLCRPPFEDAFQKLCEFARDCISEKIETKASFVVGFDDGEVRSRTPQEYKKFAAELGIKSKNVILRQYVEPIMKRL